jgi:hypothetical protein
MLGVFIMALHFIGVKDLKTGKRGRFFGSYDDKEFESLMEELGGNFPKNYFAWHIEQEEIDKGSKRIDEIKKLPLVMAFNPFVITGETHADAREFLLRAKRDEDWEKEYKGLGVWEDGN